MIQYCRYCSLMCCGDVNYCSVKKRTFTDNTIKSPNKCKHFEFNPIDALAENNNEYKPRARRKREDEDEYEYQIKLF